MATNRGFNIENFRAFNNKTGNLRNNRFLVEIPFPRGLNDGRSDLGDLQSAARIIELTCDSITLPGVAVQGYPTRRYGYGATEMKPVAPQFSPVQATFTVDEKAYVTKFFNEWMRIITNFTHNSPIWDERNNTSGGKPMAPYQVGYKDDYAVDLKIYQYDMAGNQVRITNLRQAFPLQIGEVQLAWAQQHEVQRLPVVFTFMDWYDEAPVTARG